MTSPKPGCPDDRTEESVVKNKHLLCVSHYTLLSLLPTNATRQEMGLRDARERKASVHTHQDCPRPRGSPAVELRKVGAFVRTNAEGWVPPPGCDASSHPGLDAPPGPNRAAPGKSERADRGVGLLQGPCVVSETGCPWGNRLA